MKNRIVLSLSLMLTFILSACLTTEQIITLNGDLSRATNRVDLGLAGNTFNRDTNEQVCVHVETSSFRNALDEIERRINNGVYGEDLLSVELVDVTIDGRAESQRLPRDVIVINERDVSINDFLNERNPVFCQPAVFLAEGAYNVSLTANLTYEITFIDGSQQTDFQTYTMTDTSRITVIDAGTPGVPQYDLFPNFLVLWPQNRTDTILLENLSDTQFLWWTIESAQVFSTDPTSLRDTSVENRVAGERMGQAGQSLGVGVFRSEDEQRVRIGGQDTDNLLPNAIVVTPTDGIILEVFANSDVVAPNSSLVIFFEAILENLEPGEVVEVDLRFGFIDESFRYDFEIVTVRIENF